MTPTSTLGPYVAADGRIGGTTCLVALVVERAFNFGCVMVRVPSFFRTSPTRFSLCSRAPFSIEPSPTSDRR